MKLRKYIYITINFLFTAMCASKGIASLALAYYGHDDLPSGPENIDVSYITDAADYLLTRPEVIPDRCGIISHCLGSLFGLSATIFSDKIKAIVAVNAVAFGFGINNQYKGQLLMKRMDPHFYKMNFIDDKFLTFNKELFTSKYLNSDSEYLLPIERIPEDKHVLLGAGLNDTYISYFSNKSLETRMLSVGKRNIEVIEYEDAGHIIEVPHGPMISNSYQPYYPYRKGGPPNLPGRKGVFMLWGGTAEGNYKAQVDWWKRSCDFIFTHIRDESLWYQQWLKKNA